jgi:hypothetical protein
MSFASEVASMISLLTCWRSLAAQNPLYRVNQLNVEADRCARLAQGAASFQLAKELEEISQEVKKEATDLSARMQAAAYHISSSPRSSMRTRSRYTFFEQLQKAQIV